MKSHGFYVHCADTDTAHRADTFAMVIHRVLIRHATVLIRYGADTTRIFHELRW